MQGKVYKYAFIIVVDILFICTLANMFQLRTWIFQSTHHDISYGYSFLLDTLWYILQYINTYSLYIINHFFLETVCMKNAVLTKQWCHLERIMLMNDYLRKGKYNLSVGYWQDFNTSLKRNRDLEKWYISLSHLVQAFIFNVKLHQDTYFNI